MTNWERSIHSIYRACLSLKRLSVCVCVSFPFGFMGWLLDLIVLVPDHCLFMKVRPAYLFLLREKNDRQ